MKVLKFIYSIYAFITFIAIMLLIFPFAIIAGFLGRIKGGNMMMWLCRLWADIWFPVIFIFHKIIYEAPHDKKRSYIFVTNHISYLDAAILPKVFRQPFRPLARAEMSKLPIFGFIYRNAVVSVDRSSSENRTRSVFILKSLIKKGISVLVFPEGTFNMTTQPLKEFYDGAFRVAIETQTPIKPVLFLDAYRRMPFESIFLMTPGRSRILYLDEISVEGYTVEKLQQLKEEVYVIMEKKLIEYDAAWKPLPPEGE